VRSVPAAWHAPTTEAQVCERVAAAAAAGQTVRVVGGAHSWSAIARPEQVALQLDALAGVVALGPDTVTVRAGTRLADLLAALAAAGRDLAIVGSIAAQSIGGLVGTGTHGSSLAHGNLSSLVERMRLVDGRGAVHDLAPGDPRLPGARVHVGALGVVTEVTLRTVPAFQLAETVETIPIGDVPAQLDAIARSAEYVKVWWLPDAPGAAVFRYARTDEPTSTRPDPRRQRRAGRIRPLVAPISRAVARTFARGRRVGPSALMLSTPMPARHRETEAAVPLARAGEAVERLARCIARGRHAVSFPVEVRFVRGDDAWLSPAHGADTCQLGAYCHGPRSGAYFAAFWRELRELGARPHWGKELDHTADEVRAAWPRAADFARLRDALDPAAPTRTFASAFHTQVLGP
jgi:FAD/FMN-containing dehydrogenase